MNDLPTSVLNSRLTMLSEEKCRAIYDAALTIIADMGMVVPHAGARELLLNAGASAEGADLVRIPREMVGQARASAPAASAVSDRQRGAPIQSLHNEKRHRQYADRHGKIQQKRRGIHAMLRLAGATDDHGRRPRVSTRRATIALPILRPAGIPRRVRAVCG